MNNLQVETIKLEPAKIEFNHEQIEQELEENLKKYEGLTFTEDSTTELRKVIAELNKGKNAVDRYRIDTKNELNQPILEFEEKCKTLNKKFDDVVVPLKEQLDDFVKREREAKRKDIEQIIERVVNEYELDKTHASELVVENDMLAKSRSMKSIEDTLTFQAIHLKTKQDKLEGDKKLIDSNVRAVNAEHGTEFSAEPYIRLLEFEEVDTVLETIKDHVLSEVKKREEEEERRRQEELEKEKGIHPVIEETFEESFDKEPQGDFATPATEMDSGLMPDPFVENEPNETITYEVSATKEEHDKIKRFLFNLDVAVKIND